MAQANLAGPIPYAVFENFVMRAGPKKLTLVKRYKAGLTAENKKPPRDYYAEFKGKLRSMHSGGVSEEGVKNYVKGLDESEKNNVQPNFKGYLKLLKSRKIANLNTASMLSWDRGGLRVTIRPDMHGELDGVDTYFRFYMKKASLTADRAQILLELMFEAIESEFGKQSNKQAAVIDCRRARIYTRAQTIDLDALQLEIEASYWVQIFDAV